MVDDLPASCEHCESNFTMGETRKHSLLCEKMRRTCTYKDCSFDAVDSAALFDHLMNSHKAELVEVFTAERETPTEIRSTPSYEYDDYGYYSDEAVAQTPMRSPPYGFDDIYSVVPIPYSVVPSPPRRRRWRDRSYGYEPYPISRQYQNEMRYNRTG